MKNQQMVWYRDQCGTLAKTCKNVTHCGQSNSQLLSLPSADPCFLHDWPFVNGIHWSLVHKEPVMCFDVVFVVSLKSCWTNKQSRCWWSEIVNYTDIAWVSYHLRSPYIYIYICKGSVNYTDIAWVSYQALTYIYIYIYIYIYETQHGQQQICRCPNI